MKDKFEKKITHIPAFCCTSATSKPDQMSNANQTQPVTCYELPWANSKG